MLMMHKARGGDGMTILISAHPHKHLHQSNMALNVLLWPASADDAICTIPYSRKISIVIFVDVIEFFMFLFSRITRPCTCVRTRNASYAVRSVFFEAIQRTVIRIIQ